MAKNPTAVTDDPEVLDAEEAALSAQLRSTRVEWLALLGVLALACVLRFIGITWGLPNALHLFSYHPDETVILFHSLPVFGSLNVFTTDWDSHFPHFYNYGSLQLYIMNVVSSFVSAYGLIGAVYKPDSSLDYGPIAHFYLLGRCITAVMGVLTVWAVWATARRLWGFGAALVSAAALAVVPLHAQHSHFLTVDVPATLWVTLSIYWSVRVLRDDNLFVTAIAPAVDGEPDPLAPRSRFTSPWVLAGLFAGLAMATKYNAALVILPLLLAGHFRRGDNFIGALKGTISGLAAFVIAFILACPGAVFDKDRFLHDVRYEGNHVYHHGEPVFQHTGSGWVYIVTHNLMVGLGWPMLIVTAIAVIAALWRRRPEDWLLMAFALPYYALIGAAQSRYARYEIPLLPVLALWVGALISGAWSTKPRPGVSSRGMLFLSALMALIVMVTGLGAWNILAPMTHTDPRDVAVAKYGADRTKTFGFATIPWFYTPPLQQFFGLPGPGQWTRYEHRWEYQHLYFPPKEQFSAGYLQSSKPDVVFLSEYEYAAPLRLGDPAARAYVDELRSSYERPVMVGKPTAGVHITSIDGLPVQDLPHDMLYTNPITLAFVRKAAASALSDGLTGLNSLTKVRVGIASTIKAP